MRNSMAALPTHIAHIPLSAAIEFIFYLSPAPEMGVQQKSATSHILSRAQRALALTWTEPYM